MKGVRSKGVTRTAVRITAMSALSVLLLSLAAWRGYIHAQTQPQTSDISMATQDRVQFSDWWPTKGDARQKPPTRPRTLATNVTRESHPPSKPLRCIEQRVRHPIPSCSGPIPDWLLRTEHLPISWRTD